MGILEQKFPLKTYSKTTCGPKQGFACTAVQCNVFCVQGHIIWVLIHRYMYKPNQPIMYRFDVSAESLERKNQRYRSLMLIFASCCQATKEVWSFKV